MKRRRGITAAELFVWAGSFFILFFLIFVAVLLVSDSEREPVRLGPQEVRSLYLPPGRTWSFHNEGQAGDWKVSGPENRWSLLVPPKRYHFTHLKLQYGETVFVQCGVAGGCDGDLVIKDLGKE